ncbi:hypothetical protein HKX48_000157 [Thoreauomyces humboldtii]|nr:hypothetical protein HKX48_000157 [Thoreauomyces humboldtii]
MILRSKLARRFSTGPNRLIVPRPPPFQRGFCFRPALHVPAIDPSHPRYEISNAEWTVLSLDHPLVHKQTGIRVHLIGIHHQSPASVERVQQVIDEVKPVAVCLEVDSQRLGFFAAKAELLLGDHRTTSSTPDTDPRPARLRGVRTVVRPVPSSSIPTERTLTERDRKVMARLDMDPDAHLSSPARMHYGLEMGVAVRSAYEHDAVVRAIDVHPDALASALHSPLVKHLVGRYRLLPPSDRRASWIGRLLFWCVTKVAFGRRDVERESERDVSGVVDHATYLRCWKTFFPGAYFWYLEVRNAGMVDRLRDCVRDVAASKGLLKGGRGGRGAGREDPATIVAVVGKSHVFGMSEMWEATVAKETFPLIKDDAELPILRGEQVISVDDLLASSSAKPAVPTAMLMEEKEVEPETQEGMIQTPVKQRRGGNIAPPPPPGRPPPRKPSGITYLE